MCHAAVLAVILLARSLAAEAQVAPAATSGPIPATPAAPGDDVLDRLLEPVALRDVRASLDAKDGVQLEISYSLREVGDVMIFVRGADDGSGLGVVRIGDAVAAEVQFVEGAPWIRKRLSGGGPCPRSGGASCRRTNSGTSRR